MIRDLPGARAGGRRLHRAAFVGAIALGLLAHAAPTATAAISLLDADAAAEGATSSACTDSPQGGPGTERHRITSPSLGRLTARLSGGGGDWDLAVFSARSGTVVAGSAYAGSEEVASGYAFAGEPLVVQACRLPGASGTPRLAVSLDPIRRERAGPPPSLLRVGTPTADDEEALLASGVDVTESAGPGYVDVVAHGARDEGILAQLGLAYVTRVEDLTEAPAPTRRRDRAAAASPAAGFPSGRTGTYRRLFDYSEEMKELAARYPRLVRLFTLPNRTYEGREVQGIEISRRVGAADGKSTFLQLGLHHAREWPSGEHALEWAYELIEGYRDGGRRARALVARTRTIVVPVVNPDGFNASREAGELAGAAAGRGGSANEEAVNIVSHPDEYRRKNCRFADDSAGGSCAQASTGGMQPGVDLNRNYGGLWGGPGAGTDPLSVDYRGPGPFSEPESENIRALFSQGTITGFVSNHTFSALVLRPPGLASQGPAPDERLLASLGERMAAKNGYLSEQAHELYETTGSTEDWAYYAAGGLGYTFEIGERNFHPPYAETVAEWTGRSRLAPKGGGGNRAAYYEIAGFVARRASHSVIEGRGPPGGTITIERAFTTATSPVLDPAGAPGPVQHFEDRLTDAVRVRPDGHFTFHINPSTRPSVAGGSGGGRERWTLSCQTRDGRPTGTRQLYIERAETKRLDLRKAC